MLIAKCHGGTNCSELEVDLGSTLQKLPNIENCHAVQELNPPIKEKSGKRNRKIGKYLVQKTSTTTFMKPLEDYRDKNVTSWK